MPTITITEKKNRNVVKIRRRNLKAWEAIRGIWHTKKLPNPVQWQQKIRKEWDRSLP